ncbi:heme oxygenase-like [Centroberyx affinis]|uniref:heme oxygenase-like n=1 Tax=Centroberyx affinis TaxID=166261 RepID=UPI003A5BF3BD
MGMNLEDTATARINGTEKAASDLSEQITGVIKDSKLKFENSQFSQNYLKGKINQPQYKLLLGSYYKIYKALEEELVKNASQPGVDPIYFPKELARLESLEKDLEHFFGQDWRKKITTSAATQRYEQRLREVNITYLHTMLLVAHAYTRYLGDLSGGQVLGKITQKSMGLTGKEGLSFFSFPGVTSPNRFKQLYRSRMNSIELTEEEREAVLEEAVSEFELNIQIFDDLQKMLSVTAEPVDQPKANIVNFPAAIFPSSPIMQFTMAICVALATVGMGIYAL